MTRCLLASMRIADYNQVDLPCAALGACFGLKTVAALAAASGIKR